jgi:hypothetical protein
MSGLRSVVHNGVRWTAAPSGFVSQFVGDEFGIVFERTDDNRREVRFSRYSPGSVRSREASFSTLTDAALLQLLLTSQPSARSPEGGYRS